ncbi:MAG: amidohydrolase family protein [Deltaproteobacteria bacterium]|nr:amidohydrolase family protein [Deltaproteobacteria bacterium]
MIDAHVHLFPDRLYEAVWSWFDDHAWVIHEKLHADQAIDRLEKAGTDRAVALVYAHKPKMSVELNRWIGALASRRPMVVPSATVHPLDRDVAGILRQAREEFGARVVKEHCHVLNMAPDDPRMFPVYEACIALDLPLVLHSGNGPKLQGYHAPTDEVSGAARTEAVLMRYPELRLVVPHLGCMEEDLFFAMLDRHPNLYLDTTMAMVGFSPEVRFPDRHVIAKYPGRILFGTDFPNIPYPVEAERKAIEALDLPSEAMREIMHDAAARLIGLDVPLPHDRGSKESA